MKLTKYEHACVVLEKDNQTVLIDPGELSQLPGDLSTIKAVVITHIHADHFSKSHVSAILDVLPNVTIYTTDEVAKELPHAVVPIIDTIYQAGDFTLQFYGGQHMIIHPDFPAAQNIGVLMDGAVYYPGDSFTVPDVPVHTLLVPAEAPWMKTAEAMDFITAIKPTIAIPTHDAVLSDTGKSFTDNWLQKATDKVGATYRRLTTGESLEI